MKHAFKLFLALLLYTVNPVLWAKPASIDLVCKIPETFDTDAFIKTGGQAVHHPPGEVLVSITYEPFDPVVEVIYLRGKDYYDANYCSGIFYVKIDGPTPYRMPKVASVVCDKRQEVTKPTDESKILPWPSPIRGGYPYGEFSDKKIRFVGTKAYRSQSESGHYNVEINRILGSLAVMSTREGGFFGYKGDCREAPKALF